MDIRLAVSGTSVAKCRVFRILAGDVDSISEVESCGRKPRLSKKNVSANTIRREHNNRQEADPCSSARQFGGFPSIGARFDWTVLQLAFQITGTEQAARYIYSETMLRMHARFAAFQCECSLCLYAYRIEAQLCLDYLCGERARAVDGMPSGKIGSALASPSPRERVVFELRHYQGPDLSSVSKVLDVTEELARNVLLRACHKLRPALLEL